MSLPYCGKKISDVFVSQEPALAPKKTKRTSADDFVDILNSCGLILGDKNNPDELEVDQAVFIGELSKVLNEKSSRELQHFVLGFENHIEDEIRLKWSLMPTVTTSNCETARNVSQDSLVHLLLNIDSIQEKIVDIMLSKLAEFSFSKNSALYDRVENKTVACLIISQFRWLSKLMNCGSLTDKLLELIEATPTDVQKDIIRLIPDVIDEFQHEKVAESLSETLLGNQELHLVILDTLSNLNIAKAQLSDIREKVMEAVSTASIEDLPVIVKFVLQDLDTSEAPQVIKKLQDNLDFTSTFNPIISSTPLEAKKTAISKSVESCIINVIKYSLNYSKVLSDAWIKYLELQCELENHKSLDIIVILLFLSLEINEKKIENILRNKIINGYINEDLIQTTFRYHHEVLEVYARELINVSNTLLRAAEPIVSILGRSVYIKCFIWFDSYFKQEVISSLIVHVGNRFESESNAALDTLLSLVHSHPHKMVPFAPFIKNLLDHLHEFSLNQVRKIHEMLSVLAYQGGREGSMLLDDMMIVIRKQLMNKHCRYKKMGVIGALMSAKAMVRKENEDTMNISISSEALDEEEYHQHSKKLLELVANSTSSSAEAFALFCDELSHILLETSLNKSILDWIGEIILAPFESLYVVDVQNSSAAMFDLDDVSEPVAIDLYTIVKRDCEKPNLKSSNPTCNSATVIETKCNDYDKIFKFCLKSSQEADNSCELSNDNIALSLKLSSMFRLLRIFYLIRDGNLSCIDALLGCAIILPELNIPMFSKLTSSEKQIILDCLILTINWIREIINAFSTVSNDEIRCNVLSRLQLLIELENLVCKYITVADVYKPPIANFEWDAKHMPVLKVVSKKPIKRKAKGTNKKSKKAKCNESSILSQQDSIDSTSKDTFLASQSDQIGKVPNVVDPKLYKNLQTFYREFDLEVFSLFELKLTFQKRLDILANKKIILPHLHPFELKYLLDDFYAKVRHCLNTTVCHLKNTQKQFGFSNIETISTQNVVSICIDLIPHLFDKVSEFTQFLQNIAKEADGIEDSLIFYSDDTQCIVQCLNLIFKVMKQIMAWKNFNLQSNSSLLMKALTAFTSDSESSEYSSPSELIKPAVEYVSKFSESIPSLSCAANFIQLLVSISSYSDCEWAKLKTASIALMFLKKKWFDFDPKISKSVEINANIKVILEAYLKHNDSVLKSLDFLCVEAIPQLHVDNENESFCTLNKTSLTCYYKIMISNLASYVKLNFSMKHDDEGQINEWSASMKVFHALTGLLKNFNSHSNIAVCLKYSYEILQIFIKYGIPLMEKIFTDNKDDVICLMKIVQASTRYLQHVCCHSKVMKDGNLMKNVPLVKRCLEVFVYRTKVMFSVNSCEDNWWFGNLKNRNLHGEEILSQDSELSDSEDTEEQDETNDSNESSVE